MNSGLLVSKRNGFFDDNFDAFVHPSGVCGCSEGQTSTLSRSKFKPTCQRVYPAVFGSQTPG